MTGYAAVAGPAMLLEQIRFGLIRIGLAEQVRVSYGGAKRDGGPRQHRLWLTYDVLGVAHHTCMTFPVRLAEDAGHVVRFVAQVLDHAASAALANRFRP